MITCGQEEPLQPNSQILQFLDDRQVYTPCEATIGYLNRYSFVWHSQIISGEAQLSSLGLRIVAQLTMPSFWVAVWWVPNPGEHHAYLRRALRMHYTREGWSTLSMNSVEVAWQLMPALSPTLWPKLDHRLEGCMCIIAAPENDMASLQEILNTPSFQVTAFTKKVVPSLEWFQWLHRRHATLLYPTFHHNNRDGIIVVTPVPLPINEWHADGLIDEVFFGSYAYKAWQP